MIPAIRKKYNEEFTPEKYNAFMQELAAAHPGQLDFRVAETPVFIPKDFTAKILDACESIVDIILDPKFKSISQKAIPENVQVPNENEHTQFIAFDFGVCINTEGEYEPQLIEMQGFPTLFCYEILLDDTYRNHFLIPDNFSCYLNHYNRETYIRQLKQIILNNHPAENVILLEIFPRQQKTRIDFYCTEEHIGIQMVCLTELIKEGKKLYYLNNGKKTEVKRIYNRLIFDDLHQQSDKVQEKGKILFEELDVEWCPHPNWFYRISKFTLPFIRHPYVPKTYFLHEVKQVPPDLENYVLKPLFSFAGQGVVIDVTQKDLDQIKDPENWILQRKVQYADIIPTPDGAAKTEIRMFYFWDEKSKRHIAINNLGRMSKGKMIGVRYNKDKNWVGGNCCYFER